MTNIQAVKQLRDDTKAGIKDCQEALTQNSGDITKAADWLRRKGISRIEKKADRVTTEGVVASYIHIGGRVGVLVEVNCETDFVARTEVFQALVSELALQIAAMSPDFVSREEIHSDRIAEELAGYKQAAMDTGKPEHIASKIAQGKVDKYFSTVCLFEQPYIRGEDSKTVGDLVKEAAAKLGENIRVRRFARFALGAQ